MTNDINLYKAASDLEAQKLFNQSLIAELNEEKRELRDIPPPYEKPTRRNIPAPTYKAIDETGGYHLTILAIIAAVVIFFLVINFMSVTVAALIVILMIIGVPCIAVYLYNYEQDRNADIAYQKKRATDAKASYNAQVAYEEERYTKALREYNEKTKARNKDVLARKLKYELCTKQQQKAATELKKINASLDRLYRIGEIHQDFRNYPSMFYIYHYFDNGTASTVKEALAFLNRELKLDMLNHSLTTINESIKALNGSVCGELRKLNGTMNSVLAQNRGIASKLDDIAGKTVEINSTIVNGFTSVGNSMAVMNASINDVNSSVRENTALNKYYSDANLMLNKYNSYMNYYSGNYAGAGFRTSPPPIV